MQEQHALASTFKINPEAKGESLNILLVSDIHNGWDQLDKLYAWYDQSQQKFDYVFALGDFDVIRPEPGEALSEKNNDYTDLKKVLTRLERFSAPIIYIPGNHDPIGLFNEDPKLTESSTLVQKKSLTIADGLQVVGFGGSLPGFWEKDNKFEINLDSYPYSNEEGFGKDLEELLQEKCSEDKQTLLLTHTGPWYSNTTMIYIEKKQCNLVLGSKELDRLLKNTKFNILADIHGHVHPSIGRTNIGPVQVINPGSVFEKGFGVLSLQKLKSTQKWVINKSEFISLQPYF